MKRILFVCTGNTCRSFMAEVIFKELLKEAVQDDRLPKGEYKAGSAGIFAVSNDMANPKAIDVLETEYGYDVETHKARQLSEELVEESYLILTMTDEHKHVIETAYPESEFKTHTLKEFVYGEGKEDEEIDIQDPYRGTYEDYAESAGEIKKALEALIKILIKLHDEE